MRKAKMERNPVFGFICLAACILVLLVVINLHTDRIKDLQKSNQQKSDSLVRAYQQIDTLKLLNVEFVKFVHIEKEHYFEQCRVDSIQDSYLQTLNIRTAPLLGAQ
jgi:hypothetical protein